MNNFGRFSCENQFCCIWVVVGADPYTPLSAMWRMSIIGFPSRGRLIDLSLSVLDLHQSVVGSIDYGSLLQWEKVSSAARRMRCLCV